jgi:isopentenyl diphosphate isomerase/L-lactate dehydrogenase-like FMN-dependent dehydrogenase
MCLSNNSSQTVEQVAKGAQGQLWFQFYPRQDMQATREILDRAVNSGYTAVVVTVDQQASYYERTQHDRNLGSRRAGGNNAVVAPPSGSAPRRGAVRYRVGGGRLWYNWEYVDQIKSLVKVPVLVKGIVTHEDARICVERGYDGLIVSNHGGRSMDYGPATLEVLPEIVAAVNGKIPVIVDSGFRRGSDVLKALALGAKAVWLGRASRWALGAFGPAGVEKLLTDIIFKELVEATAAVGRTTLASIDASIVKQNWP